LGEQDFIFKTQAAANGTGKKLEDMERAHILRVVEECGGNQSRAADVLDIDRVTLYHKLKKYGWSRPSSVERGADRGERRGEHDAERAAEREKKADEVAR